MNLNFSECSCFCCGAKHNITRHHAIPQRFKPLNNVLIPLCDYCHKQIHLTDISGLTGFAARLNQSVQGLRKQTQTLIKGIEEVHGLESFRDEQTLGDVIKKTLKKEN